MNIYKVKIDISDRDHPYHIYEKAGVTGSFFHRHGKWQLTKKCKNIDECNSFFAKNKNGQFLGFFDKKKNSLTEVEAVTLVANISFADLWARYAEHETDVHTVVPARALSHSSI